MFPILNDKGALNCSDKLLKAVPVAGAADISNTMMGSSPAVNKLLEKISPLAATEASVPSIGEFGTGK